MSLTKYIEQRRIEREREVRRKIRNEKYRYTVPWRDNL